jgi:hypothetical protein
MTDKETQALDGVASELNAELDLTSDDLDNLRHMVGASSNIPKRQWGYRNHFAAGEKDIDSMNRLETAGYVTKGKSYRNSFYYHATLKGCKAIGLSKAATKRALEDW